MALRAFFDLEAACLKVELAVAPYRPNSLITKYSETGFLLESKAADTLERGNALTVVFSEGNKQSAEVCWTGPGIVGCLFSASQPPALWESGTVATPDPSRLTPVRERRSDHESLGTRLRRVRMKKGIRQETMAAALSVSTATISYWEADRSIPKPARLAKIAQFLDVQVSELTGLLYRNDDLENVSIESLRAQLALKLGVNEAHLRIFVEVGGISDAG